MRDERREPLEFFFFSSLFLKNSAIVIVSSDEEPLAMPQFENYRVCIVSITHLIAVVVCIIFEILIVSQIFDSCSECRTPGSNPRSSMLQCMAHCTTQPESRCSIKSNIIAGK